MRTLNQALRFYRTRHRTPGCKLTHLIGIPLLVAAPFAFIFNRRTGITFTIVGAIFQVAGHAIFEKNQPTLLETRDPMTIPASLLFILGEWKEVIEGRWIADNGFDLWRKRPLSDRQLDFNGERRSLQNSLTRP